MNNVPVLTIGIPTFNRSRHLAYLLEHLKCNLYKLEFEYEVLVGDNDSSDDTISVCENSTLENFSYFKHSRNLGPKLNTLSLIQRARGKFFVRVADDDLLILEKVNEYLKLLISDDSIGILYAPWTVVDLHAKKSFGLFYKHECDTKIGRGEFKTILNFILDNNIFSEIYIGRTELLRSTYISSSTANIAFIQPYLSLRKSAVFYATSPFYYSIASHPSDTGTRKQLGHSIAASNWDSYRGGLEILFAEAKASDANSADDAVTRQKIEDFLQIRLAVAARLRCGRLTDPLETYLLTKRLGSKSMLDTKTLDSLRKKAAIQYLVERIVSEGRVLQIIVAGSLLEHFHVSKCNSFGLRVCDTDHVDNALLRQTLLFDCKSNPTLDKLRFIESGSLYLTDDEVFREFI